MSLSRRTALFGGCSAVFCACASFAAKASDDEFICTTIEPDPGPDLAINDFVANAASSQPASETQNPFRITPFGTIFKSSRWQMSDGLNPGRYPITLGVELRTADPSLRDSVIKHALEWLTGDFASIFALRFDLPRDKCEIRVAFDQKGGNSSEVGRVNLKVPKQYSTMNLAQPTARGIRHEFGHAFGLLHEHAHPTSGIIWNKAVVEAELKKKVGWSPATVKHNIFDRYAASSACVGDPKFNAGSVMLYEIPSRWTLNGFSSVLNPNISDRDHQCLVGTYRAA